MKLTETQLNVALNWWTGAITRAGVRPLTERQIKSFRDCMQSLLHRHDNTPGSRAALSFIDGRPSVVLAHCLAYPGMQVDEDGGRAEAIPWDNVPPNTIMMFGATDVRLFTLGTEQTPGEVLTPEA